MSESHEYDDNSGMELDLGIIIGDLDSIEGRQFIYVIILTCI
jgi:hypothetical protein